jgi:hypothetical protein
MKKLNSVLAASALALVAAQSQAALLDITVTSTNVTTGATNGNLVSVGTGTLDDVTGTATWQTTSIAQTYLGPNGTLPLATSAEIVTDNTFQFTGLNSGILTQVTAGCTEQGVLFADYFFATCTANPVGTTSSYGTGIPNFDISAIDTAGPITFTTSGTAGAGQVALNASYSIAVTGGPSPVPVPAAAWLFGSALVGLAGIGRKRKA